MNPIRSVGARLSLSLGVVVLGALAIVWVALVPSLQNRLVDGRLQALATAARVTMRDAQNTQVDDDFVTEAGREAEARVVYFQPLTLGLHPTLDVIADSARLTVSDNIERDPVALRAENSAGVQRGQVTRGGVRYAEAAVSDPDGNVILYSASLHSTLKDVDLVRQRLLWSGLVGFGVALIAGFAAASLFARRIRRLERAADRIASGDFAEPVVDHGRDELGELAGAFDSMRLRLARLDDARREFIANASHELRTPIFSLGGFLELLRDEELDEETRAEFLETAGEQVERLSKLATDLLDLSRLDAGPVRLDHEAVELGSIADDLSEEFAAVARRRGRLLEVQSARAGIALGDRQRVLQIGRALVDNALAHTPDGTRIRIIAGGSTLAVEDDGPGIPGEYHEQVFVRFTRLEGSRASGTGLGLAIARELAERMGGALELESTPGRTIFTLRLPAFSRENAEAAVTLH